jgi:hypothetical protein
MIREELFLRRAGRGGERNRWLSITLVRSLIDGIFPSSALLNTNLICLSPFKVNDNTLLEDHSAKLSLDI